MSKATQSGRFAAFHSSLGKDALLLRSMNMQEQMSRVYNIDLEFLSENGSLDFNSIIGQTACVELDYELKKADTRKRFFHGVVTRFVQSGSDGSFSAYRATLVPSFWLLTLSSHCRIFRDSKVPDILEKLFGQNDVRIENRLHRSYQKLEFCVQYRETDFNFCSRLMEQEGIYYYFVHAKDKHTMVLVDSADSHDPFPGYDTIEFRPHASTSAGGQFIQDWSVQRALRSNHYTHTDFDFTKPRTKLLETQQTARYPANQNLEIYDYPGGFSDASVGEELAKIRMDEIASQHEFRKGAGSARGISVGFRFRLGPCPGVGFPRAEDFKEYLVVTAHHSLRLPDYQSDAHGDAAGYHCNFTAIAQDKQFRPPRSTPKPFVQGIQTATVVGAKDEEIHTDKYGRVRVQFHWDRDGRNDEKSSCWIRVAQNWAGKNWGSIFTPRIGQEVIVEFLEGDPDRPLITGCVYNADHLPPFPLPEKRAISGIKTNSTKGGQGHNEWTMDDTKGAERIVLHGQRDMEAKIERDRTATIGRNDTLTVTGGDQITKVEAGKSVTEAMQSIELKVGSNSIKIDQTGITINGRMIRLN